jgi:hypothetical protein
MSDYRRGWLVIRLNELIQLVTTSTAYALSVLHTSQITIGYTASTQSVTVFTSRCLVAASNCGHSPFCGFLNYHRSHLPTSHNNSSQQLNSAVISLLTNWLTHSPTQLHSHWLILSESKPTLCEGRRSVGQSVLVSSTHLGPKNRFVLLSDSCGFVDVGRPFSRKDGFVVYRSNCCRPSPATDSLQSSPVLSSKLLLALASTAVLGVGPPRDPWLYFCSFQTFTCFEMRHPLWRE